MVIHAYNPSTWENLEFESNLGYRGRLFLKKKKKEPDRGC
jgi:hypothetical protein